MAFGRLGARGGFGSGGLLGGASKFAPSWVATDFLSRKAVFDADYFGGVNFYWNGTSYASEALLNTAMGATKSGVARTFTPYVFGANLVTNGTFDSDVSGWINGNNATPAWSATDGGSMQVTSTAGSPSVYQSVANDPGKGYALQGQGRWTAGTAGPKFVAAYTANLSQNVAGQSAVMGTSSFTSASAYFSPWATGTLVGGQAGASGAGNINFFDNITCRECSPFQGLVSNQLGVKISATAPATIASTIVLWQAGGNETGRVRLEVRTDFSLHYIVTFANGINVGSPNIDMNLGTLTASTSFTIEAQAGVDMFSASLNGGTRVYSAVSQMPGLPQMWIGRSFTGETWTGTIERVSVFNKAHSAASYLVVYGDSLPGFGAQFPFSIAAACVPPRRCIVKSQPGAGIASIKDNFLTTDPVQNAGGWLDPNTIYLIEGGYNDQSNSTTAVPANRPAMIAALLAGNPNTKYLIYNIPNGEAANQYSGGAVYNAFVLQNSNDLTTYGDAAVTLGGHMLKIREALVAAHDGTAQDLIDFGHDIEPISCRVDAIHPNTKGIGVWAAVGLAGIQAQGWSPLAPT